MKSDANVMIGAGCYKYNDELATDRYGHRPNAKPAEPGDFEVQDPSSNWRMLSAD